MKTMHMQLRPVSAVSIDPSEPYTAEYEFVSDVDKFKTTAGNTAVFLKRDQGYDMLFVQFEGTPYIECCYIKGFSYEEMHQFADEMYLEETDKEVGWSLERRTGCFKKISIMMLSSSVRKALTAWEITSLHSAGLQKI